jgi:hypothetical protein
MKASSASRPSRAAIGRNVSRGRLAGAQTVREQTTQPLLPIVAAGQRQQVVHPLPEILGHPRVIRRDLEHDQRHPRRRSQRPGPQRRRIDLGQILQQEPLPRQKLRSGLRQVRIDVEHVAQLHRCGPRTRALIDDHHATESMRLIGLSGERDGVHVAVVGVGDSITQGEPQFHLEGAT